MSDVSVAAWPNMSMRLYIQLHNENSYPNPDSYPGDGTSGIYIWGAQIEVGTSATSYIKSISAATIRQPDLISISQNKFASISNNTTLTIKAKPAALSTNRNLINIATDNTPITQILNKKSSSKNLLTQTENFTFNPWNLNQATLSKSTVANPITSSKTVWKLSDNSATSVHYVYYNGGSELTIGTPYTYSVYAKANGRNYFGMRWYSNSAWDGSTRCAVFNLSTGKIESYGSNTVATIRDVGNGWYRCSITIKPTESPNAIYFHTSSNASMLTYQGDDVSGTLLYGAQLELNEKPTKYIPEPAYAFNVNGIESNSYQSLLDFDKTDTYAISINSTTVSFATNGKYIGSTTKSTTQVSTLYLASDTSGLNQFNGHICKISIYPSESTIQQLISLSS